MKDKTNVVFCELGLVVEAKPVTKRKPVRKVKCYNHTPSLFN